MSLTELTQRENLKLTTLEYRIESEGNFLSEPIIQLFCRDEDGNRRKIEVEGFYPSFYITEEEYQDNEHDIFTESMVRAVEARSGITSDDNRHNSALEQRGSSPRTTLEGEKLVKIETVVPTHVADMRDYFDRTWEADVFFTNRFLVDSGIKDGLSVPKDAERIDYDEIEPIEEPPEVRPRIATIDIEVWSGGKFPNTQDPKKPITAVTIHDSYTGEYEAAVLHPDAVEQGGDHTWDEETEDKLQSENVLVFRDEAKMLGHFNNWIREHDPDLMTGWNSSRNEIGSGFDYPYWINRCKRVNEWTVEDTSPTESVFVTERGSPVMGGREMFDMLQAYKKTQIHEKRSYSLGYIAEEELGYGKEDVADLDEGWLHKPVEFMEYNVRDVEAVVEIEKSKKVIEMYDHIRSITGATYSEIVDSNIGIIDMLFLRQAKEKGYALPTSERPDVQHYWGAWVKEPVSGKHKNVVYPDMKSLYPYNLIDMNMSPETIIGDSDDLRASEHDKSDCHVVYVDNRDEETKKEADNPERDELYVLKPEIQESFIREVVRDMVEFKYQFKQDEYADEAYDAAKRVTNCHTPDTKVFTTDGPKYIRDVVPGDTVYSYNNEDGSLVESRVSRKYEHEYTGDIIDIQTDSVNFSVTPEHELLTHTEYSEEFEKTSASEIDAVTTARWLPGQWSFDHGDGVDVVHLDNFVEGCDIHISHPQKHGHEIQNECEYELSYNGARRSSFTVCDNISSESINPKYEILLSKNDEYARTPAPIDGDVFAELLGWYVSEGHVYMAPQRNHSSTKITQCDDDNRKDIIRLVEEIGFECYSVSSKKDVNISSRVLAECLKDLCGDGARNKKLPELVFNRFNKEQKETLMNYMMRGDGHDSANNKYYSTSSERLASDFARLLLELGQTPRIRHQETTDSYKVLFSEKENTIRSLNTSRREYTGKVYDIEVEGTHTYVAGRDGKYQISHNSTYGVLGDSVSYGKGFRLFDWRIAEAITLAGRDIIQHTAEEFEENMKGMGYHNAQIVGGDTDSCVCTVPDADGMQETINAAQGAAKSIDYDEFMQERFNIEDTLQEVEIESYAESALFMDAKKRYAQWVRWDEGDEVDEIEYKGFELVRSDSAQITAEVQSGVIERILRNENSKEVVGEYLKKNWDAATSGNIETEDIGRPSAINNPLWDYGWSKSAVEEGDQIDDINGNRLELHDEYIRFFTPQPHIRGARYANEHIDGEDLSEGSKPMMFYCDGVSLGSGLPEIYDYDDQSLNAPKNIPYENRREIMELGRTVDAVAVEDVRNLPDGVLIDWEKMAGKTLRDPIEPIVDVMEWDFDDLITDGEQSDLSKFM